MVAGELEFRSWVFGRLLANPVDEAFEAGLEWVLVFAGEPDFDLPEFCDSDFCVPGAWIFGVADYFGPDFGTHVPFNCGR